MCEQIITRKDRSNLVARIMFTKDKGDSHWGIRVLNLVRDIYSVCRYTLNLDQ